MGLGTYSAAFSAVAVSAAQDLFEIVAPSNRRVTIKEIRVGQYSDFGDAAAELVSVLLMRGHTTTGSGGSAVTPVALAGASVEPSTSTVVKNNTTVATSGDVQTVRADTFNVMDGFSYRPRADERIRLEPSQRFVVRITAPADALTMNATVLFEETY